MSRHTGSGRNQLFLIVQLANVFIDQYYYLCFSKVSSLVRGIGNQDISHILN